MKWLFALLLALAIFGGAAYFSYNVLFKQEIAVQKEQRGEVPSTPPPDLSLPEFQEAAKVLQRAHTEARSVQNGIALVKLMGRHAGFLTA